MAVKIKLKRLGKIRAPYYRVVVADAHTKRDGRAIEEIGKYHPKEDPSFIEVDSERVQYWLGVGARPTEPVLALLKLTGDWQRFRGEPSPPPLKVPETRPNKLAVFEEAAKESAKAKDSAGEYGESPRDGAGTAKAKSSRKAEKKPKTDTGAGPKDKGGGSDTAAGPKDKGGGSDAPPAEGSAQPSPPEPAQDES